MIFLFLSSGFPGVRGSNSGSGIGTYLRELTLGLQTRGHVCHVVVWGDNTAPRVQDVEGVRIYVQPRRYWRAIDRVIPEVANLVHRALLVWRLNRGTPYDWIEIQSDEGIDLWAQRAFSSKAIIRSHTTLAQMVYFKQVCTTRRVRRLLRRETASLSAARYTVTHCYRHSQELMRLFPFMPQPSVVSHGIAVSDVVDEPQERTNCDPMFLIVGTIDRRKGSDRIIPALLSYVKAYGPCVAVFVSSSSEEEKEKMGMLDQFSSKVTVQWLRSLSQSELIRTYKRAAALLHLARYESFGFPLVEAAAVGVPVVATRTGVAPRLLDGELARLLVDGDDPRESAEALAYAILNRRLISDLLKKRYLSEFTRDHMVDDFLELIGRWRDAR